MVIFHTDHWGALSFYIALSVEKHRDDFKVILIPEAEVEENKKQILLNLCNINIFDKIILFKNQFPGAKLENVEEITDSVLNSFDSELKNNGVSIARNDIVYSSTDFQGIFRLYLIKKKIKYINVMLNYWDIYDNYHDTALLKLGIVTKTYMDLLNDEHVFDGTNKYCKKILAFPNTVSTAENESKLERFILSTALDNINNYLAEKILTCFIDKQDLNIMKEADLILLSQSNGYIKSLLMDNGFSGNDYYEQVLMYQEILDFYAKEDGKYIVVKPHPNNYIRWKEHLQDVIVVNKNMPIELVRLCKEIKIKKALSIQTSSLEKMEGIIENSIITTDSITFYHRDLYSLYVCCALYAEINQYYLLEGAGFRGEFFKNCLENIAADMNIKTAGNIRDYFNCEKSFFRIFYMPAPVDIQRVSITVKKMDSNSVIILIGTSDNLPLQMIDENLLNYVEVIQVYKECIRESTLASLTPEYIWAFTKSKEIRNKIKNVSVDKVCKNVGVEFHSKTLNNFEKYIYFDNYKNKNELCMLNTKLGFRNKIHDPLKNLYKVTSFEEYIYRLSQARNLMVFISVKDNAGKFFTYTQMSLIDDLNLKTKWNQIGWDSYIVIIDNKNPQVELLSKDGQPLVYDGIFEDFKVHIESHSYDNGNFASIKVNDIDYAVNETGFNFVVYDKVNKRVIDSVCFNAFNKSPICFRRYERT